MLWLIYVDGSLLCAADRRRRRLRSRQPPEGIMYFILSSAHYDIIMISIDNAICSNVDEIRALKVQKL